MTGVVQDLINGLVLGTIYGGLALGLSLVLGVLGTINVAHSALLVLAALLYYELVNGAGIDVIVAIVPVLALFFMLGIGMQRVFVRRLQREAQTTTLLVFFGLMVVVESIAVMIWTTDTRRVDRGYLGGTLRIDDLHIPISRLVAAGLTIALFLGVYLILTRTLVGIAIRGMAQNRDVAEMTGIAVNRLAMYVFGGGVALAAFGGMVLGLAVPFTPQEHVRWLAWAFLIVIIGGMGNVGNTLLAGLAVGVTESFVSSVLSFQYTYLVIYLLLALALLVRSEGLRGSAVRSL